MTQRNIVPNMRLVESTKGWSGTVNVYSVPYMGDPRNREFELYLIDSGVPGPCVGYESGDHGNEMISVALARRIAYDFRYQIARGSVFVISRANVPAVDSGTRIAVGERRDQNRCYANKKGRSVVDNRALTVLQTIRYVYEQHVRDFQHTQPLEFPGVVICGHTEHTPGNYPIIPYTRIDRIKDKGVLAAAFRSVFAMGVVPVMEYLEDSLMQEGLDGALSYVLSMKHKIPSITLELGPAGCVDDKYVDIGITMMHRLLKFLNMRARDVYPEEGDWGKDDALSPIPYINNGHPLRLEDIYCTDSEGRRLDVDSGILKLDIKPGDFISAGTQIGQLENWLSLQPEKNIPLHAQSDHYVLSLYPVSLTPKEDHWYTGAVPETDSDVIKVYNVQRSLLESFETNK